MFLPALFINSQNLETTQISFSELNKLAYRDYYSAIRNELLIREKRKSPRDTSYMIPFKLHS